MLQSAPRTSPNTVTTQGHVKRTVQAFNEFSQQTTAATSSKPPSPADLERERRLAEALRANLRKRKAQAREARPDTPPRD